ncbi:hypothetical protein SLNWT_0149 [Streptomyces albus]|uniref:Uncharacterized protein n=1 Tax=Streptomyces albus (strain ATCC 21838 / DSM 41398 / FERM P-419 / JCM 4703 / NBRC 107858) TaxID=1081613 RepID=A0A0B5EMF0_STRA4|nr:hypothetical protein SLNWT_0149 [Streptomyces albus]AOU74843.1 hypothetical protein SLNHY_0152 [Streptomyces albus]AYN30652.1 hypothetical protein DUI70_0149 [Streptomyces albus]
MLWVSFNETALGGGHRRPQALRRSRPGLVLERAESTAEGRDS